KTAYAKLSHLHFSQSSSQKDNSHYYRLQLGFGIHHLYSLIAPSFAPNLRPKLHFVLACQGGLCLPGIYFFNGIGEPPLSVYTGKYIHYFQNRKSLLWWERTSIHPRNWFRW